MILMFAQCVRYDKTILVGNWHILALGAGGGRRLGISDDFRARQLTPWLTDGADGGSPPGVTVQTLCAEPWYRWLERWGL